jgi:hypothetical protein
MSYHPQAWWEYCAGVRLHGSHRPSLPLLLCAQGWGNFANTLVLVALMAAFKQTQAPYDRGR